MGYCLEISKKEYCDCGGALYGYISDDELKQCKSWQWLKKHHNDKFDDNIDDFIWGIGSSPGITMWPSEYKEFIKLYIDDYNKFSSSDKISLKNFEKSLSSNDKILVEWW